jgi:hypothetical protein
VIPNSVSSGRVFLAYEWSEFVRLSLRGWPAVPIVCTPVSGKRTGRSLNVCPCGRVSRARGALKTLPCVGNPLASNFSGGPQLVAEWSQLDRLDEGSSAILRPWQRKRFRNTSRTNAEAVKKLSCGRTKKPTTSSRCTKATIALESRPSRKRRLQLKSWPKRESQQWAKRESLPQPKQQILLEVLGESQQPHARQEQRPAGRSDDPCMIFAVSGDPTL